jgi:hypothetical protein
VTVVVAGTGRDPGPPPDVPAIDATERARALLAEGLSRRDAADRLADETGLTRNAAYRLVNQL